MTANAENRVAKLSDFTAAPRSKTRRRLGNVDATVGKGMWWSTEEQ